MGGRAADIGDETVDQDSMGFGYAGHSPQR
jgi:hypothetical protein